MARAHIEDDRSGGKVARWSARQTLRRLDLPRVEHWKQLVTTRFDEAHELAREPKCTLKCALCIDLTAGFANAFCFLSGKIASGSPVRS